MSKFRVVCLSWPPASYPDLSHLLCSLTRMVVSTLGMHSPAYAKLGFFFIHFDFRSACPDHDHAEDIRRFVHISKFFAQFECILGGHLQLPYPSSFWITRIRPPFSSTFWKRHSRPRQHPAILCWGCSEEQIAQMSVRVQQVAPYPISSGYIPVSLVKAQESVFHMDAVPKSRSPGYPSVLDWRSYGSIPK